MRNTKWVLAGAMIVLVLAAAAAPMLGGPGPTTRPGTREVTLWSTIKAGGLVGLVIILMSFLAVALIVEHFSSIRRERIIPVRLEQEVADHLAVRNYDEAAAACRQDGSFLGRVIEAGLAQRGGMFGFFDMQTAMQEVSEREVSRLYRKLEYLSFIAAAAPMAGLLGTVTGMIRSFNTIAATEGAALPSDLAGGISEALVTTCMGLIVAIPAMFFVSQFRNRIDSYVAEAETVVERLMGRFRKAGP